MPDAILHEFAPAKINLALHILGRREDGYHELESLVAFADIGDQLTLEPGNARKTLAITGPMASLLAGDGDNLILKAVQALAARKPGLRTGAFTLEKNLPVASGIGGGSADAAAALRLTAKANGLSLSDPDILAAALATGADVPVCLGGQSRIMRGIGDALDTPLILPGLAAVLINPGIGVSTPAVFQKLGLAKGQQSGRAPLPPVPETPACDRLLALLHESRNDLESPAVALEPWIGAMLDALRQTKNCLLARMSGSGATVFGLYPDRAAAREAAASLERINPRWWVRPATLQ